MIRDDVHRGLLRFAHFRRETSLIRPVVLLEKNKESLEWLTLWEPKPDAPEPVAGDSEASSYAAGQLGPV